MLVFTAWLCASIVVVPKIDVGLDVELTMTDDSYVLKYFQVRAWRVAAVPLPSGQRSVHFRSFFRSHIAVHETVLFDGAPGVFRGHRRAELIRIRRPESAMWRRPL